jgi:hypothetical protein
MLQRHLRRLPHHAGMVLDLVADELDRLHERIADRFARAEPRGSGIELIPLEFGQTWTEPASA